MINVQPFINQGYALTGNTIGETYNWYRLAAGVAGPGNLQGTINLAYAQNGNFNKSPSSKNPEYVGYYDVTNTQVGDIFTGNGRTFFVSDQSPLLPPTLVKCDRVFTVSRGAAPTQTGLQTRYSEATPADAAQLMTGVPGSCLQGTKGEKGDVTNPDDVRNPWWNIRLPLMPGITLATDDFLIDDLGRNYSISSAELTDNGWRLTARQDET